MNALWVFVSNIQIKMLFFHYKNVIFPLLDYHNLVNF